eukprot:6532548-Pyramimonas_sp.AAC.1
MTSPAATRLRIAPGARATDGRGGNLAPSVSTGLNDHCAVRKASCGKCSFQAAGGWQHSTLRLRQSHRLVDSARTCR